MPESFVLLTERDRRLAIASVARQKLGVGMAVYIGRERRNLDQNARLHALLSDIADQLPWPRDTGEIHDIDWWKRRCTLGWLIDERKERQAYDDRPEVITSLDGSEFGILVPHTSELNVDQCARLILWTESFGLEEGVVFKEPQREEPPPLEYAR